MSKFEEIPPPIPIRVNSLNDLARFMASAASFGQPVYALCFEHNNLNYIGVIAIYRDYYKWYGIPVFYYHESEIPINGSYILVRSEEIGEMVRISSGIQPGWITIPIVKLKSKPNFLQLD